MFRGVCPNCGSINNISVISVNSSNCVCNSCNYKDASRVFNRIRVGDILKIEGITYLVRQDGLYKLEKQVLSSNRHKIKIVGDIKTNPEKFYKLA